MGNKWSPGCNCTCECNCLTGYANIVSDLTGITIAGFGSTPIDLTGFNGTYTVNDTGGCSGYRQELICEAAGIELGESDGFTYYFTHQTNCINNCGLGAFDCSFPNGGLLLTVGFYAFCDGTTLKYVASAGFTYCRYRELGVFNGYDCGGFSGMVEASSTAGLIGSIPLTHASPEFLGLGVTATVS